MAIVFGANPTIEKIIEVIENLSELEQKKLLAQLRAEQLVQKGVPEITQNPAEVPMKVIDQWKHDSRKKK
ncbi:MAG: hypothetical protein KF845_13235 [Cyclobacteriaceae bacterium]|nr:hypothetical protein [Cyclobacteriaceae bacterium]